MLQKGYKYRNSLKRTFLSFVLLGLYLSLALPFLHHHHCSEDHQEGITSVLENSELNDFTYQSVTDHEDDCKQCNFLLDSSYLHYPILSNSYITVLRYKCLSESILNLFARTIASASNKGPPTV
jgi:hypothetical protein